MLQQVQKQPRILRLRLLGVSASWEDGEEALAFVEAAVLGAAAVPEDCK